MSLKIYTERCKGCGICAAFCPKKVLAVSELEKIEAEMKDYKEKEEDVLSYALFPQQALDFFKFRQAQKFGIDPNLADVNNKVYPV